MTKDEDFSSWIGREQRPPDDQLTSRIVRAFEATFAPVLPSTDAAPIGIHWCLFAPAVPELELGNDGHPRTGDFLPPVPLPRRMWAGGEVNFLGSIREGDTVEKSSKIMSVTKKKGTTGELFFVNVAHSYFTSGTLAIAETQNIVYRAAAKNRTVPTPPTSPEPKFDRTMKFPISSVTLFRYSALTFNAHRIHFDQAYARDGELYSDLVVHGPLQATALLNFATRSSGRPIRKFSYRGTAPAMGPQVMTLGVSQVDEESCELCSISDAGLKTMEATAAW